MDEDIESGLPLPIEEMREDDLVGSDALSISLPLVRNMICTDGENENASQNKDNIGDVRERDSDKEQNKSENITALEICKR